MSLDKGPSGEASARRALIYDVMAGAMDSTFVTKETVRKLHQVRTLEKNGPLYWLDNNGKSIPLKFPVLLDLKASNSMITPYFNSVFGNSIILDNFKKSKVVLEARTIPKDIQVYPESARKASELAMVCILKWVQELEKKRGNEVKVSYPYRSYEGGNGGYDGYTFLLHTEPVFSMAKVEAPDFTTKALDNGVDTDDDDNILPSPSKIRQAKLKASASARAEGVLPRTVGEIQETTHDHYKTFFASENGRYAYLANSVIVPPNILDVAGNKIHPTTYQEKLVHLVPAVVEVLGLRLWEIFPKEGSDKLPSRNYQLLIKSIQILSDDPTDWAAPVAPDESTSSTNSSKRKIADVSSVEESPAKRVTRSANNATTRDRDVDMN